MTETAMVPRALHALLTGVVDYAGLFPPAGLPMPEAVAQYAAYRRGTRAWMLGRFIVSASRIEECEREAAPLLPEGPHAVPWRLSGLIGADLEHDAARLVACNARHRGTGTRRLVVDSVECKVTHPPEVEALAQVLADFRWRYCELPFAHVADDGHARRAFADLVDALAVHGLSAKLRTGGMNPSAIPSCADLAWALAHLAARRVPFKATAGLHHPVRAEHALTYAPSSPRAVTHGFVNVFVAAVAAHARSTGGDGADAAAVEAVAAAIVPILDERAPSAFRWDRDGLHWRECRWTVTAIDTARTAFAGAFGSCSFDEPIDDLRRLRWLP